MTAAVPDPRFRDQLAEDVHQALYDLIVDHPMWIDGQGEGLDYTPEREIRIGDFLDAATAAVAARVQAAANQRAAEELEATLDRARQILRDHGHGIGAACLPPCWDPERRAARAAALASPAPAPHAEEGQ